VADAEALDVGQLGVIQDTTGGLGEDFAVYLVFIFVICVDGDIQFDDSCVGGPEGEHARDVLFSSRVTSSSGLLVYCRAITFHKAGVGNISSGIMVSESASSASDMDVMEGHDM
jgi:hypothetical protein